jgi:hypothetical protein
MLWLQQNKISHSGDDMTAVVVQPDIQQKLAILSDEASDEVTSSPTAVQLQHAADFIFNAKRGLGICL